MTALEELISSTMPAEDVVIDYTRNRRTVLSLRRRNGTWRLRAHEIFRNAPDEILHAVVRLYFTRTRRDTRRRLSKLVREYIAGNEQRIESLASSKQRKLQVYGHRGTVYDLREIFDELNQEFFNGECSAVLTWSRGLNRRKLGTWRPAPDGGDDLIRINRLFDDPCVPRFYIRQLVLHEMLHGVFGSETHGSRTIRHTKQFRESERSSPMYERAKQWEKDNLKVLYRRRIKESQNDA